MESKSKWIQLGGRVALGAIFLISGLGKGRLWSDTAAHAASKGVPEVLLAGAVALELLGAAALLLGLRTRWGAAALVAFLVPVTLVFHDFWNIRGGRRRNRACPSRSLPAPGALLAPNPGSRGARVATVPAPALRSRTMAHPRAVGVRPRRWRALLACPALCCRGEEQRARGTS